MQTMFTNSIACDGCGQSATPIHMARRLQRLEWATRYRPVHIGSLLLGGVSPLADEDFLYAGRFEGEAGRFLEAAGISRAGKPSEIVLSEFQRGGFFLTHILECPLENGQNGGLSCEALIAQRVSYAMVRIRRSLKPKRVVLTSELLVPLLSMLTNAELGCPVVLDGAKPFGMDASNFSETASHLHETLAALAAGK